MRVSAAGPQESDRLERQHAPGSAAVGDYADAGGDFAHPGLKLSQGDVQGAGDVAVGELVGRPDVQKRHQPVRHPLLQRCERHGFQGVASVKVVVDDCLDAVGVTFAHRAQGGDEVKHVISGEPVNHLFATPLPHHQPDAAQRLQVLRCIGDGEAGLRRQGFNALLTLREVFEQVQAVCIAETPGDLGEGGEEVELGGQVGSPVPA